MSRIQTYTLSHTETMTLVGKLIRDQQQFSVAPHDANQWTVAYCPDPTFKEKPHGK